MYPTLYDVFLESFGLAINGLRFVNTFGFFVALAFFVAFYVSSKEMKWRAARYKLPAVPTYKMVGEKVSFLVVGCYAVFGFLFGYKLIGIFSSQASNSIMYLASTEGSVLGGILLGGFLAYSYYKSKKKDELPKPEKRTILLEQHQLIETALLIALIAGLLGAKLFHNLENIDELIRDPWGSIFSFSGLTFYGGLICAAVAIIIFLKKNGVQVLYFTDSILVGVMLAYGVGRLGCHFAGDGDWGIVNTTPNPIAWLPNWWWSYSYPNNVLRVVLEQPVFPTPMYEAISCIALGFVLMWMGRKIEIPGVLTGVYALFAGVERLLIEQIRVNTEYHIGGLGVTQAEIISVICIIFGSLFMGYRIKKFRVEKI